MSLDSNQIAFVCPLCHKSSTQPPELLRREINCPHCHSRVICIGHESSLTPSAGPNQENQVPVDLVGIENEPIVNSPLFTRKKKSRPGQFSVLRMLTWTTAIAVAFALWRFRQMYQTIVVWVGVGIFGCLGIFILLAAMDEARFIDRLLKIGKRTHGKLCRYYRGRGRIRYAVVRFRVEDKVYEIRTEHGRRPRHLPPIGTVTGVIYPPEAPEEARIIPVGKSTPEDKTGVLILFGLFLLIGAAVACAAVLF